MAESRTNVDQFQLRLPPGHRSELKIAAEKQGRSLNAEIVTRLSEYDQLRSFWEKADLLKEAIHGLESELATAREQLADLQTQNDNLRIELARTKGMNESLQQGVNVFMDRLLKAAGDKGVSMQELLHAITKPAPQ